MNYMANVVVMQHNADQAILMVLLTLTAFALAGMGTMAFMQLTKMVDPNAFDNRNIENQRAEYNAQVEQILRESANNEGIGGA